jgi:alpha-1,2-mannosyltransferase
VFIRFLTTPGHERRVWRLLVLVAAVTALAARLVPVLRGGGLRGLGNYDDGVYYAAGTALAHGLLPYRDFLLLHPPGIVLTLAPFGLLARVSSDAFGFAAARLTWMCLGVINTVLVARILRPIGRWPAALGALFYALAVPAVFIEYSTLLEAPAQTCVLLAMAILTARPGPPVPKVAALMAGALLGASATFKIWGVVAVVVVAAWFMVGRSWRTALQVLAGSALAVIMVCLPFFAAAPGAMWRMVVLYQANRWQTGASTPTRLAGIVGLGLHRPKIHTFTPVLVATLVLFTVLLLLAWTVPAARLAVVMAVSLTALLLLTPSWFMHYPGLACGPLAVALAAGAAAAARRLMRLGRHGATALAVVLACAIGAQAYPLTGLRLGQRFAGATLGRDVAQVGGCVTADDPAALVEMNVLTRNLDRGCTFVADLGGYSYELAYRRGHAITRHSDPAWQRIYLAYLRSGSIALPFRYASTGALSSATRATLRGWSHPLGVGRFQLREVPAAG